MLLSILVVCGARRIMRSVSPFSLSIYFFPARCAGCDAAGEVLSCRCVASLGEPLTLLVGKLPCLAVGTYSGPVRSAVLKMKNGRRDVGERLGLLLAERAEAYFDDESSCFVPVPTTPKPGRSAASTNLFYSRAQRPKDWDDGFASCLGKRRAMRNGGVRARSVWPQSGVLHR